VTQHNDSPVNSHNSKTLRVIFVNYFTDVTSKLLIFSDDFHGIWDTLIFDSDVKAQVRKWFL